MTYSNYLSDKQLETVATIEFINGGFYAQFYILQPEIIEDCSKHGIEPKVKANLEYPCHPNTVPGSNVHYASLEKSKEDNPLLQYIYEQLVKLGNDPNKGHWKDLRFCGGWSFLAGSKPIYTTLEELIHAIDTYLRKRL